jgi:molecular chaperone DnaK
MKEHGDKVPAGERSQIEGAANNLKDVMKKEDAAAIRKATEALQTAAQSIGKIIYEETAKKAAKAKGEPVGAAAGGDAGRERPGGGKKDDDVIDAEFEVKE